MNTYKQIEQRVESELMEKLASIEHIRWAKWQVWVHNRLQYTELKGDDGNKYAYYLMTSDDYERWEKQINTDYQDLTESEKESDRREVRSYLPLLKTHLKQAILDFYEEVVFAKFNLADSDEDSLYKIGYNDAIDQLNLNKQRYFEEE
jgi:hypothetical protein